MVADRDREVAGLDAQRPWQDDQNEKARWSSSIETCFDCPAVEVTLAKPFSSRTGRATLDSTSPT